MARTKFRLNKRSEMIGQIFIYSLSLIIVSSILIFGYTSIRSFIESGNAVEIAKFKRDTQTYVSNYVTEYGSVGYKKLKLPHGANEICITDVNTLDTNQHLCNNSGILIPYFLDYYSAGQKREKKNFFLFDSKGNYMDSWYVGNISLIVPKNVPRVSCNLLCIPNSMNGVDIMIVGKGNHAEVTNSTYD